MITSASGQLVDDDVVDGGVVAAAQPEAGRGVGLRVEVDEQDADAPGRQLGAEVDRGRRLADAALLVGDCEDHAHGRLADAIIVRRRSVESYALVQRLLGSRDVAGGAIVIAGKPAGGSYRYLARLAFADADRHDGRVVLQRQVDDAALVRRHRLQGHAAAGGADAGGGALGQADQRFFAAAAVAVHVDGEGDAAIGLLC